MGTENELTLEQSMKWLHFVCEQYKYGSDIYNIFVDTLNGAKERTGMIVSPANLGDTVFIASLAETYKQVQDISKLIIVAKNRQAEAVKWFSGVDDVFGMSDEEIIALKYYFTISKNFLLMV